MQSLWHWPTHERCKLYSNPDKPEPHQFVNLIEKEHRIVDTNCAQASDNTTRHWTNVCPPVTTQNMVRVSQHNATSHVLFSTIVSDCMGYFIAVEILTLRLLSEFPYKHTPTHMANLLKLNLLYEIYNKHGQLTGNSSLSLTKTYRWPRISASSLTPPSETLPAKTKNKKKKKKLKSKTQKSKTTWTCTCLTTKNQQACSGVP